jgi:hypothetical protein
MRVFVVIVDTQGMSISLTTDTISQVVKEGLKEFGIYGIDVEAREI